MTNKIDSELGIFSLNEKRNLQIDEALIKNQKKAKKIGGVAAASPDLASIIKSEVEAKKSVIDYVFSSETKKIIDQTYKNAENLFGREDMHAPTPEQFEEAGVDFDNLAKIYERMEKQNLEPSFVISPILPITSYPEWENNDKFTSWEGIYKGLSNDKTIYGNPLGKDLAGIGINRIHIAIQFKDVFDQETDLITKDDNIHNIISEDGLNWTIAVISNADIALETFQTHEKNGFKNDGSDSKIITVSQYITLQANRILSSQAPLDDDGCTWLNSAFNTYNNIPYVIVGSWWSMGVGGNKGRIILSIRDIDPSESITRIRQPFWG